MAESMPIYDRYGRRVAQTLVDPADRPWLEAWVWRLHGAGYVARTAGRVLLYRELMGLAADTPAEVDHIDGNRLNNQRSNLRVVTHAQNGQNIKLRVDNSSGYRNVRFDKRRGYWYAMCVVAGNAHYLGSFASPEDAARAARCFRVEQMPFADRSNGGSP